MVSGSGIVGLKTGAFGLKVLGAKSYLANPLLKTGGFSSVFSGFPGENSTTGFTDGTKLEALMLKFGLKAMVIPSIFKVG